MSIKKNPSSIIYGAGLALGCLMGSMLLQPLYAASPQATDMAAQLTVSRVVPYQTDPEEDNPTIRIDRPRVNLRNGPAISYDVISQASAGDQFDVLGTNANQSWYLIQLASGESGWVYAAIVELEGDLGTLISDDEQQETGANETTDDSATEQEATEQEASNDSATGSSTEGSTESRPLTVADALADADDSAEEASADSSEENSTEAASAAESAQEGNSETDDSTDGDGDADPESVDNATESETASTPTIRIDRTRVNLRGGPGTGYGIVGNASAEETFTVVGRNGASNWYEISLQDGETAWIFSGIVELTGDVSAVGVSAAPEPAEADSAVTEAPGATGSTGATAETTTAPAASTAGLRGRLLYSVANMDAEQWELWEYNFASGTSTKIGDWWTEVDVSKDGSQIVYFAWPTKAGDDFGTWIMDRDYTNNRLVVPGGAYASFSPGGDRLVLNGGPDIYVINTDGGGLRGLTRGEYPAWSPVNDEIVHRACVGGGCGLWVIDANSNDPGAKRRLTTGGSDGQPSWSPNGKRIAYISQDDGNFEIYVINADGSGKTRLTTDTASDGLPVWSPDGQWIAFRSDRGGSWAVYVMRPDGSGLRKIVDADVLPRWFFEKMSWF